jgi:roadblock/LC7 domain-containing protein
MLSQNNYYGEYQMNEKLLELKKELKQEASEIRAMKASRCAANSGYVHGLHWAQLEYRYKHIAYCMARGRTYEQIEGKVHDCNKISEYKMDQILTTVANLVAEGI